jgi:hypothetical protein
LRSVLEAITDEFHKVLVAGAGSIGERPGIAVVARLAHLSTEKGASRRCRLSRRNGENGIDRKRSKNRSFGGYACKLGM